MMIKKIQSLETSFTVSKATIIIAAFTLLSKVVGLYRERLLATHIGVGTTLDIYFAAFRIPDFIFNLLVLGTLSVAFIPVFSDYLVKNKAKANEIANTIMNVSFLGMFVICAFLFVFAEPVTRLLLPGFTGETLNSTINLTRLLLISPIIFTLANITTAVLHSLKRFLIVSFAASLYNVGIIIGYFAFYKRYGLMGLGLGVILGALLLLIVQVPEIYSQGFYWRPIINLRERGVREIARLFVPRIFGLDATQISLLIASIIGSLLATGSITIFNLANNLQIVPVSIFAISTAVAAFPALTESFAKNDRKRFIQTLESSITQILYIIVPTTILMLIFRAYIVRLVYGAGKFNWEDTILTFHTLGIFSFALISQSLIPLFSRAFYARFNTKTPVLIGLVAMALNGVLSFVFAKSWGVEGIALGFVVANICNCIALFFVLHHQMSRDEGGDAKEMKIFNTGLIYAAMKIIFASLCMGLVAYLLIYLIAPFVNTRTVAGILIQSGLAGLSAAATYLLVSLALGLSETRQILRFFDNFLNPKKKPAEVPKD
jgi:putative peptidoglycan lipid II flippase